MRLFLVTIIILLFSCEAKPEKINFGLDSCSHCRMGISDAKFASQLVLNTGKVFKFDAIECLKDYYVSNETIHKDIHSMWVASYVGDNEFLNVEQAYFVQHPKIMSPMGMHLAAFANMDHANQFAYLKEKTGMQWHQLLNMGKAKHH